MTRRHLALAALLTTLASACGGGSAPSPYRLDLDAESVLLEADYQGAFPAFQPVKVSFVGDGVLVGYPPGTGNPGWLNVSAPSTVESSPVTVTFSVVSTGLTPGSYSATVRFVTGKADGSAVVVKDLPVRYVVYDRPTLSGAPPAFTSVAGAPEAPAARPLTFTFGGASTAWAIESDQPWLAVDRATGTGSGSVQVQVTPGSLPAGVHTAHLALRATSGRVTAMATVQLTIRARRIWTSLDGVALASLPGRSALQREVKLFDNAGTAGVAWAAASDQPWLTAEPVAGDRLRLTADPADLPLGLSLATVTVTSDGAQVENAAPIRVGLWKADAAAPEGDLVDLFPKDVGAYPSTGLAVDPIRPRLYVVDLGPEIRGFNVHTGALEVTFPALAGETLAKLVVSSDGRWLYAGSYVNPVIHRLDLDTGEWATAFPYTGSAPAIGTTFGPYIRPEGHPLLLGNLPLDAETGERLGGAAVGGDLVLEDQRHLLVGTARYRVDYDHAAGTLASAYEASAPVNQDSWFATATADGSRIFTGGTLAYGYGFNAYGLDPSGTYEFLFSHACTAYPNVALVGDSGVLYAGRDAYYDTETVTAYGADHASLGTYSVGTYRSLLRRDRGMKLSSDGLRLLLLTTEWAYGAKTKLWGFATKP